MKIIDSKGRLFGVINLIDFLAVFFLISLIPIFYFGRNISERNNKLRVDYDREFKEIELSCNLIKLTPDVVKNIKAGDEQLNENGERIARISWLGESRPYEYKIDMGPGSKRSFVDKELYEVRANIVLKVEIKDEKIYFKDRFGSNKQVNINSEQDFVTKNYAIKFAPKVFNKEKWIKIKIKFLNLTPELSSMINKGYLEKDSSGRIIGKMVKIIKSDPSQISAMKLEENKLVFLNDPYRNDILANLEIMVVEKEGNLYFKDYPVKIGSAIALSSDLYMVNGLISGFDE